MTQSLLTASHWKDSRLPGSGCDSSRWTRPGQPSFILFKTNLNSRVFQTGQLQSVQTISSGKVAWNSRLPSVWIVDRAHRARLQKQDQRLFIKAVLKNDDNECWRLPRGGRDRFDKLGILPSVQDEHGNGQLCLGMRCSGQIPG